MIYERISRFLVIQGIVSHARSDISNVERVGSLIHFAAG